MGCTSLQSLNCVADNLSALDVTSCTNLQTLNCSQNSIGILNIDSNPLLKTLTCYENQLTALNISNNNFIERIRCYTNMITSIDVSNKSFLIDLTCYDNELTSLTFNSNNTRLTDVACGDNLLTTVDISMLPIIKDFYAWDNQFETLDLSTTNNTLRELDVRLNPLLTELNIANGNNVAITYCLVDFNPLLECIQTDSGIVGTNPAGWQKDAGAVYGEDCAAILNIEDQNFTAKFSVFPNPAKDQITIKTFKNQLPENYTVISVLGKEIIKKEVNSESDLVIKTQYLDTGVYFIKINLQSRSQVIRFIKA